MPENTTSPFTIAPAHLTATAAYRLPQLLAALGDWLKAETTAGRLADDHRRLPADMVGLIGTAVSQAAEYADDLAAALNTAHNLAATLHDADPVARLAAGAPN